MKPKRWMSILVLALMFMFFLAGCAISINTNLGWNNSLQREMHDLVQDYEIDLDVKTGDIKSKRSIR